MRSFVAIAFLAALVSSASAVDLTKIERTIRKEPAYKSKPKYCLLVFGAEAKTRVWVVLDGDVLYADRNGNSDLTEAGERIGNPETKTLPSSKVYRTYSVGNITARDGKLYEAVTIHDVEYLGHGYVHCTVKAFPRHIQHATGDRESDLRFAENPSATAIVHFDGPLKMNGVNLRLERGLEKPLHLHAVVGTPGIGACAEIAHDNVDAGIHPVAVVEFPPKSPASKGPKITVHLTERC